MLASTLPDSDRGFGTKAQVDPLRRLILGASAWGGNPDNEAKYLNVFPGKNDGKTIYRLTVKGEVPADGFWSIGVYAEGYFERNERGAYTVNNLTAKRRKDQMVQSPYSSATAMARLPTACRSRRAGTTWCVSIVLVQRF